MAKVPMETLRSLPQTSGNRFSSGIAIGFDKVELIRAEHLALRAIAAMVTGLKAETLSQVDLQEYQDRLTARRLMEDREIRGGAWSAIELLVKASEHGAGPEDKALLAADAAGWILALGR